MSKIFYSLYFVLITTFPSYAEHGLRFLPFPGGNSLRNHAPRNHATTTPRPEESTDLDHTETNAPPRKGLPIGAVRRAINYEYYNRHNNYDKADEYCFIRAHKMANQLMKISLDLKLEPVGSDRVMGNDDDLIFKIIMRYPKGEKWHYHIAACYVGEDGQLRVPDPIRGALEPWTTEGWLQRFGHKLSPCLADVNTEPPTGTCHYNFYGMQRYNISENIPNWSETNRLMLLEQPKLDGFIWNNEMRGVRPYPLGSR